MNSFRERGSIKDLLDEKYNIYNNSIFIETDPIQVPHLFADKENIEISAFLTAIISWGKRSTIVKNALLLMNLMDNNPFDYLMNADEKDFQNIKKFCHRTFNTDDTLFFLKSLAHIYKTYNGLEAVFTDNFRITADLRLSIQHFRKIFFELQHPERTEKHIADISKGASAKRINMFLRWMVRKDDREVDFGLWNEIPASALFVPLDIHTGNVARNLGLITRNQNNWKSVEELTAILRSFDPFDPVKYDFALFGMGINEGIKNM
jgi:uncharacterized protein (TIGR02757 family)